MNIVILYGIPYFKDPDVEEKTATHKNHRCFRGLTLGQTDTFWLLKIIQWFGTMRKKTVRWVSVVVIKSQNLEVLQFCSKERSWWLWKIVTVTIYCCVLAVTCAHFRYIHFMYTPQFIANHPVGAWDFPKPAKLGVPCPFSIHFPSFSSGSGFSNVCFRMRMLCPSGRTLARGNWVAWPFLSVGLTWWAFLERTGDFIYIYIYYGDFSYWAYIFPDDTEIMGTSSGGTLRGTRTMGYHGACSDQPPHGAWDGCLMSFRHL